MPKKPERVSSICKTNSQLHWLAARTQQLDKLNTIFQNCLPLQFSQHCYLANIHDNKAIIHCDNAAYANMMRFQSKVICDALSTHLPHPLLNIDVKVRPVGTHYTPASQTNIELSNKTAALIDNTADSIEEGPLKTALKKLASRQAK